MIFCIVHYNTPELTSCLCASLRKYHKNDRLIIFDNSDKKPFQNFDLFDAEYIDNTKQQYVNFEYEKEKCKKYMSANEIKDHEHVGGANWGSMKHSATVQWLIDNINQNFILLDSDILIKKSIDDFWKEQYCVSGEILENRLLPFLCFINVDLIHKNDIKFFRNETFNACYMKSDTGGTFLSEILNKNMNVNLLKLDRYIVHFGNGSWRHNRKFANLRNTEVGTYQNFLIKYQDLWR